MYLTLEKLYSLNACGPGVEYIKRFYPDGAEVIDIIRDRHIDKRFLHWGREHLTISNEEFLEYQKACKIENCTGFWESTNLKNSHNVSRSKNIKNSIGIIESINVTNSVDVAHGDEITDSSQIFYSSMVEASKKIYKGQNIAESNNVCESTMIVRSQNIINSFDVFDSSEIINSRSVSNSSFCRDCKNIKFCMFCHGLEDSEYCIFNLPVDKTHYEFFAKQYERYFNSSLIFVKKWPKEILTNIEILVTRKYNEWYSSISDEFWKWIRTLPGFEPMKIYEFTMLSKLLV